MGGALAPVEHWGMTMTTEHNFGRDPAAAMRLIARRVIPEFR